MLSVGLLLAVLVCAVVRPWGWQEAVAAVPAAGLLMAAGAVPLHAAAAEAARLGPVVGFLAAVLVLADLCDEEGLFRWCGAWMARRSRGGARRLLGLVFVVASTVTAVLSLDATVVLLTPVVLATAGRLRARPKPHVYACAHLSNSASLLLPVSNLTNLLALEAAGIGFLHFAGLMVLPWLAAIGVEYVVLRRFFAADLAAGAVGGTVGRGHLPAEAAAPSTADGAAGHVPVPLREGGTLKTRPRPEDGGEAPPLPLFALVTVAGTLAGFAVASAVGVEPVWVAAAGAAVLAVRALARRRTTPVAVVRSAAPMFLLFVLALGIVVRAVVDNGLADALGGVVPAGEGLAALLGVAALAAVLANLINNLPAVLVMLPLVAPSGTGAVLAVLLGVNIGPNLTYAGSLATLLWRRILRENDEDVALGEFTRLGLLAVPAALALSVVALWASLQVLGG